MVTNNELDKLEALARAATPGPWIPKSFGRIVAGPMQQYVNGKSQEQIASFTGAAWMRDNENQYNAEFCAAANPATVLQLIELARSTADQGEVAREQAATMLAQRKKIQKLEAELARRSTSGSDERTKTDFGEHARSCAENGTVPMKFSEFKASGSDGTAAAGAGVLTITVQEWVYHSARDLAVSIWRDNYKDTAPQWEPLDDLPGVLSQIDNMVTGMRRPRCDQSDAVRRLSERLKWMLDADQFLNVESMLSAIGNPAAHPDDAAVDRFASAMKAKMAASRAKGRGGWDDPSQCPAERLQVMLAEHLAKGDPVDVGNFAMMLFNRGDRTATSGSELATNWPHVPGRAGAQDAPPNPSTAILHEGVWYVPYVAQQARAPAVSVKDALRRCGADTDYHGKMVFTVPQFEHFVSMLAAPAPAAHSEQDAKPQDCGHGHVYPNANGLKARCGGPAMCAFCASDLAAMSQSKTQGGA